MPNLPSTTVCRVSSIGTSACYTLAEDRIGQLINKDFFSHAMYSDGRDFHGLKRAKITVRFSVGEERCEEERDSAPSHICHMDSGKAKANTN